VDACRASVRYLMALISSSTRSFFEGIRATSRSLYVSCRAWRELARLFGALADFVTACYRRRATSMPTKKEIVKACSGACRAKRPRASKGIPGSWMASIASLSRWPADRKARGGLIGEQVDRFVPRWRAIQCVQLIQKFAHVRAPLV
jgi:hypothetical protein